jgi:hemolysin D
MQERVEMRKTLYDHSTGSKASYLELLQPFVEGQQELKVQKSKISEADSALAAIIEERAHTDAEYRRDRFGELVEAERKARGLRDDVVKAQHRTRLQELVAPVAGTVQQLSVHTIGGVVTPAQAVSPDAITHDKPQDKSGNDEARDAENGNKRAERP